MYRNYNKSNTNISTDIFNKSGQNVMSNNKTLQNILTENQKLKEEINRKNKEIEDAKKRLNILEKEVQRVKGQKQNNKNQTNRGRSVGIKRVNHNNIINNNFGGGMFGDNDPFNDSFFKFPGGFNNEGKTDDSFLAEQMGMGFF